MREIKINSNEANQRVDKFLSKYLDKANKSFIYKMLRKKNITLNNIYIYHLPNSFTIIPSAIEKNTIVGYI